MSIDRNLLLEKLKDAFEYDYNIVPVEDNPGLPLVLRADFHSRGEGYVLVKSAKIWAMEANEHLYLFSADEIDEETAKKCLDYAVQDAFSRVKPHSEHKETSCLAVFVADKMEPEVLKLIRRRKEYRSYKFGLHGWSNLRACAVCLGEELVVTNKAGSCLKNFYTTLLRSESK